MPNIRLCFYIFTVLYLIHVSLETNSGIDMIPERLKISYFNTKYIANCSAAVRRISRGGKYVVHLSGYNIHTWANNVSLFLNFQEFLHNEYRRTFVELGYKLCDYINNDIYGSLLLKKYGVECPLYPKNWDLRNITIYFPVFPYVIPFSKCRVEVIIQRMVPTEELIGKGYLYLNIKRIEH